MFISREAINKYVTDVLKEPGTDKFSSKRNIIALSFALLTIAFFANLFFAYHLDANILEALMALITIGMGTTIPEKFSKFFPGNKVETPEVGQ